MSMGGLTDSPMEAIAIMNYLRMQHGAWAWLAAFLTTTAAAIISISRLSSRLTPIINIINISNPRSSSQLPQQPAEAISQSKEEEKTVFSSTTSSSSISTTSLSCTLEKTASGKFTLYYAHDDKIDNTIHDFMDLDDDDEDDNHVKSPAAEARKRRLNIGGCSINRCSSWSSSNQVQQWDLAALKMKKMDLGWQSHQDLARLDGNVVRLWN